MTAAIELIDVHKHFGNKQVLQGVNFAIEPGTIVGYIGQNGAGKSTTVKLILGLITASAGEIKLFGEPIRQDDSAYKKRIGYVPEGADLYDALTAREYLVMIGQLYGLTAEDANAKAVGMLTLLGLEASIDARIAGFSKGMRQLVLICASLLHDPDILFWDEPLNGLDANAVLVVEEILMKLRDAGKTIFYSSHIMDVVQKLSDRILLLDQGQVVADGTFKELVQGADTSLQQLFNELTGFEEHGQTAQAFVDLVMGGTSDGQ